MLKKIQPYLITAGVVLATLAIVKMFAPESMKTYVRV